MRPAATLLTTLALLAPVLALAAAAGTGATSRPSQPLPATLRTPLPTGVHTAGPTPPRRPPPRPAEVVQPRCERPVPQLTERLPYGPGEELGFLIELAGVYVGRVHLGVGERREHAGRVVYPLHANASANSFFTKMANVDSRMTSLIDPDLTAPLAMQTRSTSERGERSEEATFEPAKHRGHGSFGMGAVKWQGELKSGQAIQDALSVVYFARSRDLAVGHSYCVELFYGTRLWIVRGTVEAVERVSTDAGPFSAYRISGNAVRDGKPPFARGFTVWVSTDEDRLPLKLISPSPFGEIAVRIDHFKRGHRLVKRS